MSLLEPLSTAILPVLSIAVAGYLLGRHRGIDVDPLATVTMYVLAPALVFHSLATTDLGGRQLLGVVGGVVLFTAGMLAIASGTARLGGDAPRSGVLLAGAFPNSGNFGIPLSAFAFGAVGRSTAVLFLTAQSVLVYTVGLWIAARGGGSLRASIRAVLRIPLVYAVVAAGLARAAGVVPPVDSTAMRTVGLVGDAAIPLLLIVLGAQLATTSAGASLRQVAPVSVLKLAVAPALAVALVPIVGLVDPIVARTFVLEAAMPAAITPLMFVIEFDGPAGERGSRPAFVSTAILVTTLLSIPTLAILLAVLRAGWLV